MPMVGYWKTKESVEAKITKDSNGATIMILNGERYPIIGFPRGHIVCPTSEQYGILSKLKHEIKNKIFNESWRKLQQAVSKEQIIQEAKESLFRITRYLEELKYEMVPPNKMAPAVKEIHRAWMKTASSEKIVKLGKILTFILQEDDGYRYRVQWLAGWVPWIKWNPIKILEKGLILVEHAEVVRDMKERIKLLRTILMLALSDPAIKRSFIAFFKEVDWSKVKLSEGDKYHFRGKYFKTDMDILEY